MTADLQGYGSQGTCFTFEGAQNMVTFGPTTGMASDSSSAPASLVTFIGHNLSEQACLNGHSLSAHGIWHIGTWHMYMTSCTCI